MSATGRLLHSVSLIGTSVWWFRDAGFETGLAVLLNARLHGSSTTERGSAGNRVGRRDGDGHRAQGALGDGAAAAADGDLAGLDELADAEGLEDGEEVLELAGVADDLDGDRVGGDVDDPGPEELDGSASVNRELLLVKVRADAETRGQILDVVELFQAKVVDVSPDSIVVQATGNTDKLTDLRRLLEPFGIRELVQSGMVAIGRGPRSISERTLRPVAVPSPSAIA